jgi:hypothetical protein
MRALESGMRGSAEALRRASMYGISTASEGAVPVLVSILTDDTASYDVRASACHALGEAQTGLPDVSTVSAIVKAVGDIGIGDRGKGRRGGAGAEADKPHMEPELNMRDACGHSVESMHTNENPITRDLHPSLNCIRVFGFLRLVGYRRHLGGRFTRHEGGGSYGCIAILTSFAIDSSNVCTSVCEINFCAK